MINLNSGKFNVTSIQFFDCSQEVQTTEEGDSELVRAYSANIIINESLVIQLSGNDDEAHAPSVPTSSECYYNDETLQDIASDNLCTDEVKLFLERQGIENNYDYLKENERY